LALAAVALCTFAQERRAEDVAYCKKWVGCKAVPIKFDASDRTNYMEA
jgi:hypothetical protein